MRTLMTVVGLLAALTATPAHASDAVKIGAGTLAGNVVGTAAVGGLGFGVGALMCGRNSFECYTPFFFGSGGVAIGPAVGGSIVAGMVSRAVGRRAWPAALTATGLGMVGGVLFISGANSGRTGVMLAGGGVILVGSPVITGLVGSMAPERPERRVQAQPFVRTGRRVTTIGFRGTF